MITVNRFVRKPARIEAVQWDGTEKEGEFIIAWLGGYEFGDPLWAAEDGPRIGVRLIDRWTQAYPGDWIVREPDGTFGVYTHEKFSMMFEQVR